MKHAIDNKKTTTITCGRKDGIAFVDNGQGCIFKMPKVSVSSMILALMHQTLYGRFYNWDGCNDNFTIELTIHEVVDK